MTMKPTYEELEQKIKELEKETVERTRAEEELQAILDVVPVIIFQKDRDGKAIRTSKIFNDILGLSTEEVVGKTTAELFSEHGKDMMKDDQEVMESGKPKLDIIEQYDTPEGARWARTGKVPLNDKEGNVVGLIGYAADITEQKRAEEALRAEKDQAQGYLHIAGVMLATIDAGEKITLMNRKGFEILGYNEGELIGKNWFNTLVPQKIRAEVRDVFRKLMAGNIEPVEYFENMLLTKDGEERLVSFHNTVLRDPDGQITGALLSGEDITDPRKAEEALRESEEKLARSRKMESLGLLAGGVAHDLNNVLSGIVSYPDLLLMDLPEDSKLRKPIETMQESGHRAAAIVQDLLTVARGIATTKEPLNLNVIVSDYLDSPEFNKLKQFHPTVTVKTNLDTDLFNIGGSHVHIRKVVMNLVANASEAIAGNGNVTISTMNRYIDRPLRGYDDVTIGEYAVLAVSDDGSGISSDDLERIFEPFYTKKVMSRSGTGLGLAVVWNTVQDHKGYIDMKSDENGTTFELYFPITRDEISDKALSIPIKDYKGNGETILVVDDVESQREISCNMLDTLGYKTKAVSSGEEAVEYLKEHTVDLILLDMIMDPGINGRETYERIIMIHPNQKAIIVSGFAETDDVKEAQRLGAGKYIKKPYTLEKIGMVVKNELS
jgi:PAS domain S-box-containing protein